MAEIGSELSRRAIAFGLRVIAYDPYLSAAARAQLAGGACQELDDLLANADFISLHTPLTNENASPLDTARIFQKRNPGRHHPIGRAWRFDRPKRRWRVRCKMDISRRRLSTYLRSTIAGRFAASAARFDFDSAPRASTAEAQESVESKSRNRSAPRCLKGNPATLVNMPNLDAKTLSVIGRIFASARNSTVSLASCAATRETS